jgi:hypothetical protein
MKRIWKQLFEDTPLSDVTPHVLRHYVASPTMSRACGRLGNFGRKLRVAEHVA